MRTAPPRAGGRPGDKGNAPKRVVVAAIQACGFDPVDDNEADAIATLSTPEFLFIGAARIVSHRDGTYTPAATGEWVVLMGVFDRLGELCDLVAWQPDHPGRWWLRVGDVCPLLGAGNLELAVLCHESITVHPTPEARVRAAGRGVCILDWDAPLNEIFDGVVAVECSNPTLKHQFRQALRRREPSITIKRQEVSRAA